MALDGHMAGRAEFFGNGEASMAFSSLAPCKINARRLCRVRGFLVAAFLVLCLSALPFSEAISAPARNLGAPPGAAPMSMLDPGGPAARSIAMVWVG